MFILIFGWSNWAWNNSGYVIVMMTPVISLINSRQIVCNVTKMSMDPIPMSTLWYLMFPLNRILPKIYPEFIPTKILAADGVRIIMHEEWVALFIFVITFAWYMHFALGTVK